MRRRCMFRQTDLKRALKGAVSAGIKIDHVEIRPDGVIVVVPGRSGGDDAKGHSGGMPAEEDLRDLI
jgi:hypothetical protein